MVRREECEREWGRGSCSWDLVRLGGGAPGSGGKKRKTAGEDREGCDALGPEHWRGTVGL